jgi:NADH-quinone oxidoreductase subunit F
MITESGLRGRGGAGFPTGKKWEFVPRGGEVKRYVVVNADEMEPGSFKDRLLLESNPHLLIEGALLTAYAVGADEVIVFLRWAYSRAARIMAGALEEARLAGYIGSRVAGFPWHAQVFLHRSAGRYMCGEETGLLNALQGGRANPRSKPPFPQTLGLFAKPTVVNNVETLCNIGPIVQNGASWFKSLSRDPAQGGTKLYGVSGRVKKPGLWELPMGATAREVIVDRAGGMRAGFGMRGFLPGGASTDFLTEEHLDIPMDFESLQKAGSRLGTGTIIVLDDKTCPVGMVHNLMKFFSRESCGFCTPCRDGLSWTRDILEALENGDGAMDDVPRLDLHCGLLGPGRTFCALAPGAVEPLQSALRHFRGDFERHLIGKGCPYGNVVHRQ